MRALLLAAVVGCAAPARVPPAPAALRPPAEEVLPTVGPLPALPAQPMQQTIVPTRYTLALDVDPDRDTFTATVEITGTLAEPRDVLWLHAEGLTIHRVSATPTGGDAQRLVARYASTHVLGLQGAAPLAAGEWLLSISYSGRWDDREPAGPFRQRGESNEAYLFTQLEPDYARRLVPCVDEPRIKVPWQVTITAPANLEVASNMPIARTRPTASGTKTITFDPTLPIPSYLVAFAVGPFDVIDGGRTKAGIPVRILTQRGRAADTKQAVALTAKIVDDIADWLGVPFPYPKLDVVTMPHGAAWWFAMENPGLVTIGSSALDDADSWNKTMAHEIAHHWFGDLVTLASWDELWLNEAFAEYVSGASRNQFFHSSDVQGSIVEPVGSSRNLMRTRGSSHPKGAHLLSRLSAYLGANQFRSTLETYLNAHAHGTVTSADFASAISAAANEDLRALLDDYLTHPGSSHVTTKLECSKKRVWVAVSGLELADTIVCVAHEKNGARADTCKRLPATATGFSLDMTTCPRWFLGENPDPAARPALRDLAWPMLTANERFSLLDAAGSGTADEWTILGKLIASDDHPLPFAVFTRLSEAYFHIDDPAVRDRFGAWVRTALAGRVTGGFASDPALAALLAIAGDPDLRRDASERVLSAATASRYMAVALVRAYVDATFAEQVFEQLLITKDYDYTILLRRSPAMLGLLRKHAARIVDNHVAGFLLDGYCGAPAEDILDVASKISTKPDRLTTARHIAECNGQRRRTTSAVRAFLDAQSKPAPLRTTR